MKRSSQFLTVLLLAAAWLAVPRVQAAEPPVKQAEALDYANTYAVLAGVLHWEDSTLASYPTRHRKDQELYDTLRKRGVPAENMVLLLDKQATHAAMRQALEAVAGRTKPGSTFIFYYAGHGWRSASGTEFANYDMRSGKPGFAVRQVGDVLGKQFKGNRVLLFADCCHSGGLQEVVRHLAKSKIAAAALTSADPLCVSTNNWTFTQALVDALNGDPLLDENGDGAIELGELAHEAARAMEYREQQRYGFLSEGIAPELRLAPVRGSRKATVPGPFTLAEFVMARDGDKQRAGRIVGYRDGRYEVEFYDYSDKRLVLLPAASLSKIELRRFRVGDTVTVARSGLPKGTVVEVAGNFHRVEIAGRREPEWIHSESLVAPGRQVVEVEWQKEWYPAVVLKKEGERSYIHYLGYDDSWDEWVVKERVRDPEKTRNPFGVPDVPDPTGPDVKAFAEQASLPGDDKDKNAEQWVTKETTGKPGSLEGEWSARWSGGKGTARVKVVKDRIYILYTEDEGDFKGRRYLVELVRDKDRVQGRWIDVDSPDTNGPYAGRVVGDERIDGAWGGGDRWDFRRKLKK